jgi:hypothetical protein
MKVDIYMHMFCNAISFFETAVQAAQRVFRVLFDNITNNSEYFNIINCFCKQHKLAAGQ